MIVLGDLFVDRNACGRTHVLVQSIAPIGLLVSQSLKMTQIVSMMMTVHQVIAKECFPSVNAGEDVSWTVNVMTLKVAV